MTDYSLFMEKSPTIMNRLMSDFDLGLNQAAAVLGNLGHECAGFKLMQEVKPTVKGSRGGYGWAQWTGPRRVNFENFCKRNNLDKDSDEANYAFLKHELATTESSAIDALRQTDTVAEGVRAFERRFERAGVKHYDSRNRYAQMAKSAFIKKSQNGHGLEQNGHEPKETTRFNGGGIMTPEPIYGVAETDLSFGARGVQVNALQEALASLDYAVGAKDGIFGGFTRAAVLAFQADNGLDTTGIADRQTWEALSTAPPRPLSRTRTTMTPDELAKLGSTTIIEALRTKNLGWVSAILGVLGLTTTTAVGLGGAAAPATVAVPPSISPALQALFERATTVLPNLGNGPNATAIKQIVSQLQTAVTGAAGVSAPGAGAAAAGPIEPFVREILPVVAGVLPGFPGSLLAIGAGLAMHHFGRRIAQARTMDHRAGSNLSR